jgi:hypothetical protein
MRAGRRGEMAMVRHLLLNHNHAERAAALPPYASAHVVTPQAEFLRLVSS